MSIELRRGTDRPESRADGIVSRHSFAFGPHYDQANTRFGALVTHNDDVLAPAAGFPEHPHRDLEIVTWVVSGALQHSDSSGGSAIVRPGTVARLSTGAGVRHTETNASSGETRYVQMWILPDADGPPSYETADVSAALGSGGFVAVASGGHTRAIDPAGGSAPATGESGGAAPILLRRSDATLRVARLAAGASATIPASALLHVFVARGAVTMTVDDEQVQVLADDAVRITGAVDVQVEAMADAELLAWAMNNEAGCSTAL
jgi:redox-sensitive bicupin YhaK (pirin superfamily)